MDTNQTRRSKHLQENDLVAKDAGYYYYSGDNTVMAEFHVDDSREYATMLKHLPFKGMLSI